MISNGILSKLIATIVPIILMGLPTQKPFGERKIRISVIVAVRMRCKCVGNWHKRKKSESAESGNNWPNKVRSILIDVFTTRTSLKRQQAVLHWYTIGCLME